MNVVTEFSCAFKKFRTLYQIFPVFSHFSNFEFSHPGDDQKKINSVPEKNRNYPYFLP